MLTKVINVSGASKFFGFLPPHGRTLASDGEVTLFGNLHTVLAGGLNRYGREREITALEAACDAGDICLVEVDRVCCDSSSAG